MDKTLLDGWDMHSQAEIDWTPWGEAGDARAKVLGTGDGYVLAIVEAPVGCRGSRREHAHPEFVYVVDGSIRKHGRTLGPVDAYVASIGSVHSDIDIEAPSTYLSIFKL